VAVVQVGSQFLTLLLGPEQGVAEPFGGMVGGLAGAQKGQAELSLVDGAVGGASGALDFVLDLVPDGHGVPPVAGTRIRTAAVGESCALGAPENESAPAIGGGARTAEPGGELRRRTQAANSGGELRRPR
jgi:hypothetical protein